MSSRIRRRLSYANVVSTLCLCLALGTGGAYAADAIVGSAEVKDESLLSADVRGKAGTAEAAGTNGALTGHDISGQAAIPESGQPYVNGSISTWDLADETIRSRDLKDGAVEGADVKDGSLRFDDMAVLDRDKWVRVGTVNRTSKMVQVHGGDPAGGGPVTIATLTKHDVPYGRARLACGTNTFAVDYAADDAPAADGQIVFLDDDDPGARYAFLDAGEEIDASVSGTSVPDADRVRIHVRSQALEAQMLVDVMVVRLPGSNGCLYQGTVWTESRIVD